MKVKKSSEIIAVLICAVFIVMNFSATASADLGPKASVRIQFVNMGDELCYGTLLSKYESTGPASVWNGDDESARHNENEKYSYADFDFATWKAFAEHEDKDGYYFLQEGWTVSETKEIAWTYYPPSSFKILLYYPETKTFVESGIYERYAFDTYYTVDMDGVNIGSVEYNEELSTDERIDAYRSYNYRQEILSLVARIIITIIIEMAVALIFGFRKKKQFIVLASVNAATQIILNVLLNVINYNSGQLAFTVNYILFEIIVFTIEAVLYCKLLKKVSERPKRNWYYVLYSFVANAVSFGAGFIVARILPGIF
ncbi:MAG: hypothetical protein J1E34_07980 [Oscillospiraceae bacterium]|nr:hypothetical protein [Oscillospiraceae bacterium]